VSAWLVVAGTRIIGEDWSATIVTGKSVCVGGRYPVVERLRGHRID
jgi:hypothetical protein